MIRMRVARPLNALAAVAVLGTLLFALGACADEAATEPATEPASDEQTQEPADEPAEPTYTAWTVHINDEDSYTEGGVTYTIALNLTATNPTADPAGTYTGTATASTTSVGTYEGMDLDASAIANSTQLTFELIGDPSGDGDLGSLTEQDLGDYGGSGTIVMEAAGSGTFGPAGGTFGNTSGQEILFTVTGGEVQMTISIDGHVYTFTGALTGQEAAE